MKKATMAAVGGLTLALRAAEAALTPAVVNPGFEEGKAGWSFQPNMSVDGTVAHSGRASAHVVVRDFTKETTVLTQLVPVDGSAQYVVSAWVKAADVKFAKGRTKSVGAGLIVEWYGKDRKWLDGGQYDCGIFGTADWRQMRCEKLPAPADAGFACIYLTLRGVGEAWFDDVEMRVKDVETRKVAPANGTTFADNTPAFGWKVVNGVRHYVLELSPSPDFPADRTRRYDAGGLYSYQLREPLEPGTWHWRVSPAGMRDGSSFSFVQTAPKDRDCLPPLVETRCARVEAADAPFEMLVEDAGTPTVTFAGVTGRVAGTTADGRRRVVFTPPAAGWAPGLTEGTVCAVDAAGNRLERPFWLLNLPRPATAITMDGEGYFQEADRRIFPVGIYQVEPGQMQEVRAAGFEVVHTYRWERVQDNVACRGYLDACRAAGLKAFVGFDRGRGAKGNGLLQANVAHLAARVGALADHPSLFCWYLIDEPFHYDQFMPPDMLRTLADFIRALDPYHPVVVTTGGRDMVEYRPTWDTHWSQCYGNPAYVVDHLRQHRRSIEVPSPITLLLNCNCGTLGRKLKSGEPVDESLFSKDRDFFTACACLGVVEGCNGVIWWWYAKDAKPEQGYYSAAKSPKAWADLAAANRTLADCRAAVLAKGKTASGGVRDAAGGEVRWWTKDLGGQTVLFAVNTADRPVSVDLDVAPFGPRRLDFRRYEVKKFTANGKMSAD